MKKKIVKIALIMGLFAVFAISPLLPKAQYLPSQTANYQAYNFIMPWYNQADNNFYIIKTANSSDIFKLFFWDNLNLISDIATVNLASSDFVRASSSFEENIFINWGGGSDGLALIGEWEFYRIIGGSNFPPLQTGTGLYYYGTEYGSTYSNLDTATAQMNTAPQDIFGALYNVFNAGYSLGYGSATTDTQTAYNAGYTQGTYDTAGFYENQITIMNDQLAGALLAEYDRAYQIGYNDGFNLGITQEIDSTSWIVALFLSLGSFLAIELFAGITIGAIVGVPLLIGLGFFVLKIVRG